MSGQYRQPPDWEQEPPEVENVFSATECTGLMPAMVYTNDEAENLRRMEGIHAFRPQNKQKE